MTTSASSLILGLTFCCFPSLLSAQEDAAKPQPPDPSLVLKQGIDRMVKLNSVTFHSIEAQNSVMSRTIARQIGGAMGGGEVDVRGSWSDGILRATLNDDADEILSYRGRMVARNDDVSWKLRRNRLAAGGTMPFVLDPGRFFEALQALPAAALKIKHHKATTYKDRDVLILGVTLQDEAAQDFALSGALPAMSSGMGGGMMRMIRAGGGSGAAAALPELTVDLALYVEPKTGYILKIKSRCYQESESGGNFQIQGGGGFGGDDEEEEKVQEKDKDGKRIYKRGLPVRDLKDNLSRMDFDIILTKHGEAKQLKIDPQAKKLLHIAQ